MIGNYLIFKKGFALFTAFVLAFGLVSFEVVDAATSYTLSASYRDVGETTAKLDVNATISSGTLLDRGVYYSIYPGALSGGQRVRATSSSADFTVNLSGLTKGTRYYAVAYLEYTDDGGKYTIQYSNELSFLTTYSSDDDAKVTVSPAIATVNTSTSATFQSSYTASGCTVLNAGFVYSKDTKDPVIGSNALYTYDTATALSSSFSKQITGLQANSTYYVKAFVEYSANGKKQYAYAEQVAECQLGGSDSLAVQTIDATFRSSDNNIVCTGQVTNSGASSVGARGFVYSTSNQRPEVNATNCTTLTVNSSGSSFNSSFYVADSSLTYYVRAYASNSSGTSYGEPLAVYSGNGAPVVYTRSLSEVHDTGATIEIEVSNSGSSSVVERGVVYSRDTSTPQLYDSNTKYKSVTGTTGTVKVTLTDLTENVRYYVRAYARNSQGVNYGEVKEFYTRYDATVKTTDVKNIKSASVTATGSISNVNSTLKEKGFVYSRTNSTPTLDADSKVSMSSDSSGVYEMDLSGLEANTTYYLRAFAKTTQDTTYGNVVTVKTVSNEKKSFQITFITAEGVVAGLQTIPDVANAATLSVADLKVPDGYALYDANWKYTVDGVYQVNVPVKKLLTEQAFMEGIGNYAFAPERPTTRGEVAKIIYNLASSKTAAQPLTFTDVPTTHSAKVAIDFCTANGYMFGYPDGTFGPDKTITRAEVTVVLTTVYKLSGTGVRSFTDTTSHWAKNYIALAADNGMVSGYPDGSFLPQNTTTRAEICTIFSSASKRSLTPLGVTGFTDVPTNHWAYSYIMNAAVPKP